MESTELVCLFITTHFSHPSPLCFSLSLSLSLFYFCFVFNEWVEWETDEWTPRRCPRRWSPDDGARGTVGSAGDGDGRLGPAEGRLEPREGRLESDRSGRGRKRAGQCRSFIIIIIKFFFLTAGIQLGNLRVGCQRFRCGTMDASVPYVEQMQVTDWNSIHTHTHTRHTHIHTRRRERERENKKRKEIPRFMEQDLRGRFQWKWTNWKRDQLDRTAVTIAAIFVNITSKLAFLFWRPAHVLVLISLIHWLCFMRQFIWRPLKRFFVTTHGMEQANLFLFLSFPLLSCFFKHI